MPARRADDQDNVCAALGYFSIQHLTRYCGVFPPTGQLMRRAGLMRIASAILLAGLSRDMTRMPGAATVSMCRSTARPVSLTARPPLPSRSGPQRRSRDG